MILHAISNPIRTELVVLEELVPSFRSFYIQFDLRLLLLGIIGVAWTLVTMDQANFASDLVRSLELGGQPVSEQLMNLAMRVITLSLPS